MKEIKIPDCFISSSDSPISLYDYCSSEDSNKQFINLTKNTFSFLVEGEKEVIMSNSALSINNNKFLLMQSGHCLMTEKISLLNKNYRSILLSFSNEAILQVIRRFDIKEVKRIERKSIYAFSYDYFINNYVKSIIEISKLPISSQRNLMVTKFEEIVLYLIEKNGSDFLYSMLHYSSKQSQQFISVVETNKYKKLSLKELAFLSNMSVSSFKREFVKQYSTSPIKWFQDQRLEYASLLLRNQKRASDIYLEVGYENLSSFIQAFKTKYGITPKQFQ